MNWTNAISPGQLKAGIPPNPCLVAVVIFTHDQCDALKDDYGFCGHIHPGVVISGMGKQSLRFPCFYFTRRHCVLPAFSKFTGAVSMDIASAKAVYAVVEN